MNAGDFLSSVTNGELSDNSIGITRLDDANMQKVKGGLGYSDIKTISVNQAGVFAEYQEKIDGPYLGKEYRTALGPFAYNMNRCFVMYAVTRNNRSF